MTFGGISSLSWLSVSPQDLSHIWRRYSACFSLKAASTAWGDRTLTKAKCFMKRIIKWSNSMILWCSYGYVRDATRLANKPNYLKEPPWRWNTENTALCMNDGVIVFNCFCDSNNLCNQATLLLASCIAICKLRLTAFIPSPTFFFSSVQFGCVLTNPRGEPF